MMKPWILSGLLGLVYLVGASVEAQAVSLSVDVDPAVAGIQATRTVTVGDPFTVDVVIGQVTNLHGFDFDLSFVSSVVTATGVASGNFLPASFTVDQDITAPDVTFAEAAFGSTGTSGTGVLATIIFDAVGVGMSDLILTRGELSIPFGTPIEPADLHHGKITVVGSGQQPIPEPGTVVLLGTGLGGLLVGKRLFKK